MKSFAKTLVATLPALAISALAAAPNPIAPPSTQPATQPAPVIAQSNAPLVIPDGTSPQNPGPQLNNTFGGEFMIVSGFRR